ncbi:DNA-binding transcriptional LysR family regulator [Roseibium hamelinense]|uniref:DNA-binding transcriptional LysR family regulator n=1 Tax=Roseibium hamelinense TaxID=150831 RepID=A0A562SHL9_9HYPH|nr:LysR substrate-binding domain-containing protein [Roseibium hamelinense]MTI42489.1 LysR family transcriptional regulator [Roseibium hamelinense]TWI80712.1 DNA-binding transcriptional LysR family regulator [Roseibium hamelinense]
MKNLNLVHLNGLRAVEAVGRLKSLKAAAAELGVTVGAISQQVHKTEQQLGIQLFERRSRALIPTEICLAILPHLTRGIDALSTAVAVATSRRDDLLTVSVAPVFAGKWLVWHLKAFNKANPGLRVRVEATIELVDPDLTDVDWCIRVGPGPYPGLYAQKLVPHRVFPVCNPQLGQKLQRPADLLSVPIIRDPGEMFSWNTWLEPSGMSEADLPDGPTFSDGALCLDAAIAGQGVFLAWETLAIQALRAGQIVAPFPDRYETGFFYWLIGSQSRQPTSAMNAFKDWLVKTLDESLAVDWPPRF